MKVSPVATTSPLYRTPLPLEMLDWAAYPPPTSVLRLPFDGEARIGGGYGYENRLGYSHQTIGNVNSANDFFAVDFDLEVGRPVLAVAAGRVISSISRKDSYGEYVVIEQDDGLRAIYAHLDSRRFDVVNGVPEVRVAAGEQIGTAGRSGNQRWPHLHFALHKGSRLSAHGADIGGLAVCPEPFGGYYGLRKGHVLRHDPVLLRPATRFD